MAARAALVGVASISGRLTAARARNSATAGLRMSSSGSASVAGGTGSGSTQTTRSRGHPDRDPARGEDREAGRPGEQVGERGRCRSHVLDRVEDEQAGRTSERLRERLDERPARLLGHPHRAGDRRYHQRGVAHAVERHERDPAVAAHQGSPGDLDGQPALADAADAGEGHERPVAAGDEASDRCEVRFAADQRRVGRLGDGSWPARVDRDVRGLRRGGRGGRLDDRDRRVGISRRVHRGPEHTPGTGSACRG